MIADKLYDQIVAEDSELDVSQNESVILDAAREAIDISNSSIGDITYEHYLFSDGSKMTLGSNGFVGCESLPESES